MPHMARVAHMACMSGMRCAHHRCFLAALFQPASHKFDLVSLTCLDLASQFDNFLAIGAILDEHCHVDSLLVVHNHALHESNIIGRILRSGEICRLLGGEHSAIAARSAGLHNWRGLSR